MAAVFEWDKQMPVDLVLGHMRSLRRIGKDGKVSWGTGEYHMWRPVLATALKASPDARELKRHCLEAALTDKSLDLRDKDAFLARCVKAFHLKNGSKSNKYVLLTDMTYSGGKLFSSVSDGACKISWIDNLNGRFVKTALKARAELHSRQVTVSAVRPASGLTLIRVDVEALSPEIAFHKASKSFDRVRGILNLMANQGRAISPFGGSTSTPHAVNFFRPGPLHSIHDLSGRLATSTFWYEPRWEHEKRSAQFKAPLKAGKETRSSLLRAAKSPLRDHIFDGLRRYCSALDKHDGDAALLGLWNTIEFLTGTQNGEFEVTVRRVQRVFADRDNARALAMHIRKRRNEMVHAAVSPENREMDALLHHADRLAREMIVFCLQEGRAFRSVEELGQFLDLPSDTAVLKRRMELVKRAQRYHAP